MLEQSNGIFLGYPEGIKGDKLWCIEPGMQKTIISRNVTLREDIFTYKVTNDANESSVRKSRSETTKIEVELTDDHYEVNDNALVDDERSETENQISENLKNYQLARDRKRRIIKPTQRLGHADMIFFAFSIASQLEDDEPLNLKEAMNSNKRENWYQGMSKEMESLENNQTWELIPKPKE